MDASEAASKNLANRSAEPQGSSLMRSLAYVAGVWCNAEDRAVIDVVDPATGDVIGSVPNMGPAETQGAIAAASQAQPRWAAKTAEARGAHLRKWAALMRRRKDDLAILITREQGKPLAEARGEIDYAISFLDWFAEEGSRQDGEIIPTHLPGKRLFALRTPIGVTAAITPWNFPSAMITRKAAAALAAGCTMIVRPASETPFSALALAALAEEAEIPAGVFSVVTGDPEPITDTLMASPAVRHVSFTGSTAVGRRLAAQAAATVKRVAMELGGHAPFIVFDDADLDVVVPAAVAAKFQTSGQDCLAANRFLVARPLYEQFNVRLAAAISKLKVGPGLEPGMDIGPLIGQVAVGRCATHVEDALAKGARLLTGGRAGTPGPNYFQPTLLADVTSQMRIFHEETFGPVAAVTPFDADQEAVALANDSEFALAAYLQGGDLRRLWRTAEHLEYGMIAINTVKMTGPPVPFGGMKQSGLGREGARQGISEYLEAKYLCVSGLVDA